MTNKVKSDKNCKCIRGKCSSCIHKRIYINSSVEEEAWCEQFDFELPLSFEFGCYDYEKYKE